MKIQRHSTAIVTLLTLLAITGAVVFILSSKPEPARAEGESYDLLPWINTFLFENIKEAGTYTETENNFVADHYDIAVGHLQTPNNAIQTRNPGVKVIPFTGWTQISSCAWCVQMRQQFFQAYPEYDEETIYLHNRCDTIQNAVLVKGYNSENIGVPAPGCSASTASSLTEARRPDPDSTYHSLGWYVAYFASDAFKAQTVWQQQQSLSYYGAAHPAHGLFQDNILDGSGTIPEIEKTIEYWNQPYVPNVMHQRDSDQLAFYEYVTAQVETETQRQLFWMGNINHLWWVRPDYFWFPWVSQADNLDIMASEVWVAPISHGEYNTPAWNTDCPYLNTAWDYSTNYNKGVALITYNWLRGAPATPTDPHARAFSLATYYLIKGPYLYYSYSEGEGETSADLMNTEWNPMTEENLGQPRQNPAGVVDFDGGTETDKYFDWNHPTTSPSCTVYDQSNVVMARHFDNGLVLARYKGARGSCGQNCTSYVNPIEYDLANPYGSAYYIVQSDGTLSADPVTSVTLQTNEAAVLITCTPNWSCTDWSVCSNSLQTRTCADQNSCGTDAGRPEESRTCDSTAPAGINNLGVI